MMRPHHHPKRIASLLGIFLWVGITLHAQSFNILDQDLEGAAIVGGTLIVLAENGNISTSPESSESYSLRRSVPEGNSEIFYDVGVDGAVAVAVGSDGLIARSNDGGISWANADSPSIFGDLFSVDSGGNPGDSQTWVAVGNSGGDGAVFSSTDNGQSWEQSATLPDITLNGVLWTGSRWLTAGAGFFQNGVLYQSTDRVSWTPISLPDSVGPLLRLATDGSGTVVAVGEAGLVLRSINGGDSFAVIGEGLVSGDLQSIVWGGSRFLIGGDERLVLELNGPTLEVVLAEGPGASPVRDLVLGTDTLFLAGGFGRVEEFSKIPLQLQVTWATGTTLQLTLTQSDPNRVYYLEQSTDLENWSRVADSEKAGDGGSLHWNVSAASQMFWRVAEP